MWEEFGTNVTHRWSVSGGDFAAAEAEADVVVTQRVPNHRIAGAPIEPRGSVGEARGESVTLYSATQIPHIARFLLSGILDMPEDKIRVVAPDVGGGFGAKLQLYGEEVLVLAIAKKLNRPVKYVETRSEHMSNSHHGRDQIATVTLTAKSDGTVTGCKADVIADLGAYHQLLTPFIPELGFPVAGGCYKFPAIDFNVTGVFTNKMPTDAIRGAGRPECTYWVELMMDKLAREVGMDPLELRRKNFIRKGGVPLRDAAGHRLRLGRLPRVAGQAAGELRPGRVPARAGRAAREGHPPRRGLLHLGRGLRARTVARRRPAGGRPAGRLLGVGDGARAPLGLGHGVLGRLAPRAGAGHVVRADRGRPAGHRARTGGRDPRRHRHRALRLGHVRLALASVGGEAIARAAEKVQEKAKKVCAAMLEAAPEDIELADGTFRVKGSPDKSMTMAEISGAAHIPPQELPTDIEPGLEETSFYDPENFVFPFGAHACIVDVDTETGKVAGGATTTRSTTAARPSTRC